MPSASDNLRGALADSVATNRHQVELTEESRKMLQSVLRNDMRDAFADGLKEAMTSDNAKVFVRSMLTEAQAMATEKTGEVVGNAVVALLKRGLLFVFLGSIVYALGGWSALAALTKFLKGG